MEAVADVPHPGPERLVELIAQRFRVRGESMRIRLLERLRAGEASVDVILQQPTAQR